MESLKSKPWKNQKWVLVAGARPNFMKIAPLIRAIHAYNQNHDAKIHPYLVHTGQHYDAAMSDSFFNDLDIRNPDAYLGVGSGTHGEQTGKGSRQKRSFWWATS